MEGSLEEKSAALLRMLGALPSMVIGYSGGVDSAFLCAAALRALGPERMLACLAVGPSLADRERVQAESLAAALSLPLLTYDATEMDNSEYRRNGADRCYHCKADLFLHLRCIADEKGFSHLLYGANADDLADFRPGHRAARENAALAPLAEVGLRKEEIRSLARQWGLPCHDKPASPCLSSRIPYGQEVSVEKLHRIDRGETILAALGFREFRLRSDGNCARVEVRPDEFFRFASAAFSRDLCARLRAIGFDRVVLDLEGLRSGNLNQALDPADRLAALEGRA